MSTPRVMNILDALPGKTAGEITTELLAHSGVRIERIVSTGQATPEDAPYVQAHDEWVLLLTGASGLRVDAEGEYRLRPGDCILIPAKSPSLGHLDGHPKADGLAGDSLPRRRHLDAGAVFTVLNSLTASLRCMPLRRQTDIR